MRTRAQDDADYGDGARLTMTVNVHVSADTTVDIVTFADAGRVTVTFTGYRRTGDVTLFLRTVELRELRDLLTDTLTALTDADSAIDSPTEPPAAPAGDADTGSGMGVTDRAA